MKKVLVFSGSMSTESINNELATYAKKLIVGADVTQIRLLDFEAPLYTKERENSSGVPESIQKLRALFDQTDAFIVSTPEYNSSVPAGLKNTIDWLSRMEGKVFQNKPMVLMAASPGGRGGRSVLDHLSGVMPFWGAEMVGTFSLPRFKENFVDGKLKDEYDSELKALLGQLSTKLSA